MDLSDAHNLAQTLINEHGLTDWRVRFDQARQRCGACHFQSKEISLSKHFVRLNDAEELRLTVLHEIAHALAGPNTGHGKRWQRVALKIGATGQTTNASAQMPDPRWGLRCTLCTQIVARRHRRSLNLALVRCGVCKTPTAKLQWIELSLR